MTSISSVPSINTLNEKISDAPEGRDLDFAGFLAKAEDIAGLSDASSAKYSTLMAQRPPDAAQVSVPTAEFLVMQDSRARKTSEDMQEITRLTDAFSDWKNDYQASGISADMKDGLAEHSEKFVAIMKKAVTENGYDNPQKFVATLSSQELETLRVVSSLVEDIEPGKLGREGALNLLLPRSEAKDIDNDGFTMRGTGRIWSFPPTNAPGSVKAAWAEATEGMTNGEQMMAMGLFLPGTDLDNSPYTAPDFSYTNFMQERLKALDYFKAQMSHEQYESQKEFFSRFLDELNIHNVS